MSTWSRRSFLARAGAVGVLGLGGAFAPRVARAQTSAEARKFVFVFASGGWDPTRVFAEELDNDAFSREPGAERGRAGDLRWVEHPARPSVSAFFANHHARTTLFNGVLVRSIAHDICTMIAMTGTTSGQDPDWAAILGASAGDVTLPHLVLGGPSFPGDLGTAVARTGSSGQLEALLSGEAVTRGDVAVRPLRAPSRALIDRWVARRAGANVLAARDSLQAQLASRFDASVQRATQLQDLQWLMDFTGGAGVAEQGEVAVEALSLGVSRCVTLGAGVPGAWDTHADNDAGQSPLWEALFDGLGRFMDRLHATPGELAPTLAEETTVVVLSEMGRTPRLNGVNGKDHWPFTSVMVVGPGFAGGRVIGGHDALGQGRGVDPASGEVSDAAPALSAESIGATLLAAGGVDPGDWVTGVSPIGGGLA